MNNKLVILQVNDFDIAGGAEIVAYNLHKKFLERKYSSYLFVGYKKSSDPTVQEIDICGHEKGLRRFFLTHASKYNPFKNSSALNQALYFSFKFFANPSNIFVNSSNKIPTLRGKIDNDFPSTWDLLKLPREKPNILHCHNLHGNYFDIRALPYLSKAIPTVISLHDGWLLGDYCIFAHKCKEVNFGCKNCPNSSLITKSTQRLQSINRLINSEIFKECRVYVTAPSDWLLERAYKSILKQSIIESKEIPHGVDQSIFQPYDKDSARRELNLPVDAKILLFAANGVRRNQAKDYNTLQEAVQLVAEKFKGQKILFLAIGEASAPQRIGLAEINFIPFINNPGIMARYYQSADIYLHASRYEVWGLTITEALSCGTPVIATSVGGIPDQIKNGYNGFLTKIGDPLEMAEKIEILLSDDILRENLGDNALLDAKIRFDLDLQVDRFLVWYNEILNNWEKG